MRHLVYWYCSLLFSLYICATLASRPGLMVEKLFLPRSGLEGHGWVGGACILLQQLAHQQSTHTKRSYLATVQVYNFENQVYCCKLMLSGRCL